MGRKLILFLFLLISSLSYGQGWNSGFFVQTSDFNPLDLNPVLYLRADTGVTESGGAVSQWDDLSGNGNNATQTTGSVQPTLQTTGINGLPSLNFDGTDRMTTPTFGNTITECTIAVVTKISSLDNIAPTFFAQLSGVRNKRYFAQSTTSFLTDGGTTNVSLLFDHLNQTAISIITLESPNNGTIIINKVNTASSTVVNVTSSNLGFVIGDWSSGGGRGITGLLSEFIVFDYVLNNNEIGQLESYLNNKYAAY